MLYAKSSTGTTPPASNFSSSLLSIYLSPSLWMSCVHLLCNDKEIMDERRRPRKQPKTALRSIDSEVSSIEWDFIHMTEQEEDLIYRMYRLVGDRWDLIAGRIPGRKAEEIERFWIMRHGRAFAEKRHTTKNHRYRHQSSNN
ncbi:MYB-like transcription factor ETC3 isoform X2 [Punica granatum]|uniref:MYB-like transcription factor ETC3 isoform X2 n=1 Tax=Punica granatum TaxID=22663 RepID=A0A6P8C6Q6_PUNGR|nr:MYB-like transcription factor ETC3 isoform X2 [Punica granatum]